MRARSTPLWMTCRTATPASGQARALAAENVARVASRAALVDRQGKRRDLENPHRAPFYSLLPEASGALRSRGLCARSRGLGPREGSQHALEGVVGHDQGGDPGKASDDRRSEIGAGQDRMKEE